MKESHQLAQEYINDDDVIACCLHPRESHWLAQECIKADDVIAFCSLSRHENGQQSHKLAHE